MNTQKNLTILDPFFDSAVHDKMKVPDQENRF